MLLTKSARSFFSPFFFLLTSLKTCQLIAYESPGMYFYKHFLSSYYVPGTLLNAGAAETTGLTNLRT